MTTSTNRGAGARPSLRAWCGLVVLAALLGLVPEAHAGGAILFVGKVGARERTVIRETIEATAARLGWAFTEPALPAADTEAIAACLHIDRPGACVGRILRAHAVEQLAVVQVGAERGEDGRPQLVVTQQVIVPAADVVVVHRRTCEQCDDGSLRHHVAAMTTKLLQDAASGAARTFLAITSTPPGAWISLDGDTAGATDAKLTTYPGRHTIMLRAPGYATEVRDVEAIEGTTTTVAVALRPTGARPEGRPAAPRARLPWALVGAGAAAALTGAVLVALDEDPDPRGAQGATYRDTATAGVITGAVGLAAAGVGAYLLLRRPASPAAGARVSASADHAVLGWAGEF